MRLFWIQFRKEVREQWATRKLLVVLIVMLAVGMLSPISAKVLPDLIASLGQGQNVTIILPEPSATDALTQYVKNTNQFVVFVGLLLGFIAIVGERERGQMTLMFPHALPRSTFVLAKFAALAVLLFAGMLVEALATYLYTVLLFTAPDPVSFIAITLLSYLFVLMLIALALLASTLGQTTMAAAGITFGFLMLVMVSSIFWNASPARLTQWAAALAMGGSMPVQWDVILVTLLLTVGAVAASCYTLNRQEIVSATNA